MSKKRTYGKSRRAGAVARILYAFAVLLTFAAAMALVFGYMGRLVSPETSWVFAFAGMGVPILFVLNLVLALFWVALWRWWAVVPAVVMAAGIGWVPLFFKPVLGRHQAEPDKSPVVMTWNVAGFDNNGRRSSLDSIAALINRHKPDILCIQEFRCAGAAQKCLIDSLIGLPYQAHSYTHTTQAGGGYGVVVYSRWRIVEHGSVVFDGSYNSAMWADVATGNDTLRIFNCHLQSTSVNRADVEYVEDFINEESGARTRNIASKLRRSFVIRASQVDTLAPMVHNSPHPVIVCGDFNDTPMSYAYTKIRGNLADAFVEKGTGAPNTYEGLFNLFRIDYVLPSQSLPVVSYTAPATSCSDHKPVVVGVKING